MNRRHDHILFGPQHLLRFQEAVAKDSPAGTVISAATALSSCNKSCIIQKRLVRCVTHCAITEPSKDFG